MVGRRELDGTEEVDGLADGTGETVGCNVMVGPGVVVGMVDADGAEEVTIADGELDGTAGKPDGVGEGVLGEVGFGL